MTLTMTHPTTAAPVAPTQAAPKDETQTLIDKILAQTSSKTAELDAMTDAYQQVLSDRTIKRARHFELQGLAIRELRKLFDGFKDLILNDLMNHKLGFMSDQGPHMKKREDQTPYGWETVRDICIEAFLKGFHLDGGEFMILASGFYPLQKGLARKCREFPGVTNLRWDCSVPALDQSDGRMKVRFAAKWDYNGHPQELLSMDDKPGQIIGIKHDSSSTVDNLVGKGIRKGLYRVYEQLRGINPNQPSLDEPSDASMALADKVTQPDLTPEQVQKAVAGPQKKKKIDPSKLPKTADELAQRIQRLDGNPPQAGLWKPGELVDYVAKAAKAKGLPEALSAWPSDQFEEAVELVNEFIALRQAADEGEIIDAASASNLLSIMAKEKCSVETAVKLLGLPVGSKVTDFTKAQARQLRMELAKKGNGK